MRSYETKHACYGGTLALRQAVEWKLSGAARGKAALVIAADVSLYAEKDPGEPTQGAGAVAMIVDDAKICAIEPISYAYSEPAFDFWRPVGHDFPLVEGQLSLDCYMRATERCFTEMVGDRDAGHAMAELANVCFHVPFPKMVKKAAIRLGETFGWDEATTAAFFETKVDPTMQWNRRTGNSYTASLWTSVASALAGKDAGEKVAAFSYGSGFGAELLTLEAGPDAKAGAWTRDVEQDFASRKLVDGATYSQLRAGTPKVAAAE
jgi:hydroxymethylglutaryl-CoA synthase